MNIQKILRTLFTLILSATAVLMVTSCGDSDGDGTCDPDTNENCVCETEAGTACDDPDDLDCFCFIEGDRANNNGAQDETTIEIFDAAFSPQEVRINVGGQVTWVNNDTIQRTVTFTDGSIDELLNPGASFSATFNTAGTFNYSDRLNVGPNLMGTIIVE